MTHFILCLSRVSQDLFDILKIVKKICAKVRKIFLSLVINAIHDLIRVGRIFQILPNDNMCKNNNNMVIAVLYCNHRMIAVLKRDLK